MLLRIFLSTSILFLLACANTDSEDIKTSAFCARYTATTDGSTTSVSVYWQVGCGLGGSYIELSENDSVSVIVNSGSSTSLSKSNTAGVITYSASVSAGAGDTINIILSREGEGTYQSSVILPGALSISSPSSSFTQSKGSTINVSWTGTNGNLSPTMTLAGTYSTASGSGSSSISSTSVGSSSGSFSSSNTSFSDATGNVSAVISLYNRNSGTVASSLEGGYIYGRYRTSVSGTLN
jgi:hypothetical protein